MAATGQQRGTGFSLSVPNRCSLVQGHLRKKGRGGCKEPTLLGELHWGCIPAVALGQTCRHRRDPPGSEYVTRGFIRFIRWRI